jgi:phosphate transport system protein
MSDRHLSTSFEDELAELCGRMQEMGRLAGSQAARAVYALTQLDGEVATEVLEREDDVNALEVEIDRDVCSIISRRQPAARDLRLLIAVSKSVANLERVGDEAARIARAVQRHAGPDGSETLRRSSVDVYDIARLATQSLRHALDAFARLDTTLALSVIRHDDEIDQAFEALMRQLLTDMADAPRTISAGIDLVFVAKAIERVGDHAKNIAEQVIYVAQGADVRHSRHEGPAPSVA